MATGYRKNPVLISLNSTNKLSDKTEFSLVPAGNHSGMALSVGIVP